MRTILILWWNSPISAAKTGTRPCPSIALTMDRLYLSGTMNVRGIGYGQTASSNAWLNCQGFSDPDRHFSYTVWKEPPPGKDIPFVSRFQSTPDDVVIEGWMAIRTRDDKRMVAVVSKPALYTFQNREYSCIHSAPTFGALGPGETGTAFSRIYFVEASLEEWYKRMVSELAAIDPQSL